MNWKKKSECWPTFVIYDQKVHIFFGFDLYFTAFYEPKKTSKMYIMESSYLNLIFREIQEAEKL